MCEVAKRAFLDLSGLAIGLARDDGGRRAAVGDHLDEHAHPECHEPPLLTRPRTRFTCLQSGREPTEIHAISLTRANLKQEGRISKVKRLLPTPWPARVSDVKSAGYGNIKRLPR